MALQILQWRLSLVKVCLFFPLNSEIKLNVPKLKPSFPSNIKQAEEEQEKGKYSSKGDQAINATKTETQHGNLYILFEKFDRDLVVS